MSETVSATTSAIHFSTDSLTQGPANPATPSTVTADNASSSNTPAADEKTSHTSSPATAADSLTESMSNLAVDSSEPKPDAENKNDNNETESVKEPEEELSPEEAKLRAKGLKSTHRSGFYVHIDSPRRLRIQTKSKTFDLDRYCPHANADLLKWGVLRADMTLRCGVHYWGFDLVKNGQCIAHPDETLNACPVVDSGMEW
ncbi:hypothetical protein EDD21DRAFT_379927 [Dissophora ornata]|nr:hypothetical protein BGZ58_001945 [Dissophora ornata]KAI8599418.1 hypothetical protein EDD21DRAFT_379927 [Dissophora ornata]